MEYPEIDATGELVCIRTGSDYQKLLAAVAPGGALLVEQPPSVPSWWTGTQWMAKPPAPSAWHAWSPIAKTWTDPRTLDAAKTHKSAEMKAACDAAGLATITVAGYTYDADPDSLAAMAQEVQLGASTPTALIAWTLANNIVRSHTLTQLRNVALAIRTRNTANRARYEARRATITAATTHAAVAAVAW